MKAPQNNISPAAALIPGLDVFMERIAYRYQKTMEYRNNPNMTPLQRCKASLSIDDEFDWILHLRRVQQTPVIPLPAQQDQQAA